MTQKKNSLVFIALMALAGCANTPIIDQKNGCRLLSTHVSGVKNTAGGSINFKRLDDQHILSWVTFIPRSTENTPLKKTSIILKLYRGEQLLDEMRISKGYTHGYFDRKRIESEVEKMGLPKETLKSPLDPDKLTDISSQEIWPHSMNKTTDRDLSEVACSFPLSRDEFQRIMKSDHMEILIQTHAQPIVLRLDKDNFIHLENCQKTCLK